ncbi:MAG: hypothetical protein JST26_09755 [Bacteroidetes bacterium]|nr:hypothetical protein [Bacteroidota bacterium]
METKETGQRSFVQYLLQNGRLYVDYQTLIKITGTNNKTELFRLLQKIGDNFPYEMYQNRKLFLTENAINFWRIYQENT